MTKIIITFLFIFTSICFSQNFWKQTNGPYAPAYVIAINSDNAGNIYAAVNGAGLYRSTDNGNSFSYLNGSLSNTSIGSILFDKHGHIFVGDKGYSYLKGILRSTDNGNTWTEVLPSQNIQDMVIDSSGNIFAGTRDNGLYRSTDDGITWDPIDLGSVIETVDALAYSPNGDLYVTGSSKTNWPETRTLRSTDKGKSWNLTSIPYDLIIRYFAFAPNGHIAASFSSIHGGDSSGVLISSDNGLTWSKHYLSWISDLYSLIFDKSGNSFFASVLDNDTGYWNILKSSDYGNTWSTISKIKYEQPDQFCLSSNQKGDIFAGNVSGFKRSTDHGSTWIQVDSGFIASSLKYLTILPGGKIYTGNQGKVFRFAKDKMIWLKDSTIIGSFIISNEGNYFVSNGQIYKSSNSGNSWSKAFSAIYNNGYTSELTKLSNNYIFAGGAVSGWIQMGGSVIWRSKDDGKSWDAVYSHSPADWIYTVAATSNDVLLAGGESNGVIRSTDLGNTWIPSMNGLPTNVNCKVIRVNQNDIIFLGSVSHGMFRSSDDGSTWKSINNGLNSFDIRGIVFYSKGEIIIGTAGGVFESNNNGDNWIAVNNGLIDLSVLSLACDSLDNIYVSTNAAGVFRSINSTTAVDDIRTNLPHQYLLNQNYPNPFNPTTTISFQIPKLGFVSLKIYNILGKEVATLVHEEKPAGYYNVEFNAGSTGGGLSNGVYFYQLQSGSFVETKKLILLK